MAHDTKYDEDLDLDLDLDLDTIQKGIAAPFEVWEGDHTAFVHIVWHAKSRGWTLRDNDAKIASAILRSRAMAAQKAAARRDALNDAARQVADLPETVSRDEVAALLARLAEAQVTGEH